ncbi:hypothetical protein BDZ89DRAFT_425382 [Hymenopellis radicata]|nr:hypothetical protein BDZ89DRAFT_425382 [Hymenopellis radicata]
MGPSTELFLNVIPCAQSTARQRCLAVTAALETRWASAALDATKFGKACPGGTNTEPFGVEEDCLSIKASTQVLAADLLVLLWIHGGTLLLGLAVDPRFNSSCIVQRSMELGKPIVCHQFAATCL